MSWSQSTEQEARAEISVHSLRVFVLYNSAVSELINDTTEQVFIHLEASLEANRFWLWDRKCNIKQIFQIEDAD